MARPCTADRQLADQLLAGGWVAAKTRDWGDSIQLDPTIQTHTLLRDWLRYWGNTDVAGHFVGESARPPPPIKRARL